MRFWSHTVAALKQAYPEFGEQKVLSFVATDASGASLIAALINELDRFAQPIVLEWDELHHIEEEATRHGIEYFMERLSLNVHLYMASRTSRVVRLPGLSLVNRLNRLMRTICVSTGKKRQVFSQHAEGLFCPPKRLPLYSNGRKGGRLRCVWRHWR